MVGLFVALLILSAGFVEASDYSILVREPHFMADYVRVEMRVDSAYGKTYTIDILWPDILPPETPIVLAPDVTLPSGAMYGIHRHHHLAHRLTVGTAPLKWTGVRGQYIPQSAGTSWVIVNFPKVMLRQLREKGVESVTVSLKFPHGGVRGIETVSFLYTLPLKDLDLAVPLQSLPLSKK